MNKRAEKEGVVPPPFTFTRRQVQPGSPLVFVKRTAEVKSEHG
jgi:hypothetical protein